MHFNFDLLFLFLFWSDLYKLCDREILQKYINIIWNFVTVLLTDYTYTLIAYIFW